MEALCLRWKDGKAGRANLFRLIAEIIHFDFPAPLIDASTNFSLLICTERLSPVSVVRMLLENNCPAMDGLFSSLTIVMSSTRNTMVGQLPAAI